MSFGLHLVADASRALRVLLPEVQEEILDVFEQIADEAAAEAPGSESPNPASMVAHSLIYRTDKNVTYADLEFTIDFKLRLVILDRLAAVVIEK